MNNDFGEEQDTAQTGARGYIPPQEEHIADYTSVYQGDYNMEDPEQQNHWVAMIKEIGKKTYGRIGTGFLVQFVAALILPMIILGVVFLITKDMNILLDVNLSLIINYGCLYLIGFPIFLKVTKPINRGEIPYLEMAPKKQLGIFSMIQLAFICYGAAQLVNIASSLFNQLIGILLPGYKAENVLDFSKFSIPVLIGIVAIIAPIMEEIVFRWIPYKRAGAMGEKAYVIYTSIMFGLFHMNFVQMFYAFVLGMFFAKITYRTGKIIYAIILHMLINSTSVAGMVIMKLAGEEAMNIYSYALMSVVAVGAILGIIQGIRHKAEIFSFAKGILTVKEALWNAPTLIFIVLTLFVTIMLVVSLFLGAQTTMADLENMMPAKVMLGLR